MNAVTLSTRIASAFVPRTKEAFDAGVSGKQTKELVVTCKAIGAADSRIIEFTASTENPDRSNDIIDVAGWVLDNYISSVGKASNPIFAWSHDYSKLPVGKTVFVAKDLRTKALIIRVYFPTIAEMCSDTDHPSEEALFADTVYNMYKNGMLNAVSVGFNPIKYKTRDDPMVLEIPEWQRGYHFLTQELLEVSAVLVPCNADAVTTMRSIKSFNVKGIDLIEKAIAVPSGTEDKSTEDAVFGEEGSMKEDELKALEDRIVKRLESAQTKSGAKFSAASKETISKAVDALKASHKAIKAVHESLEEMIKDETGGEDGEGGTGKPQGGAGDGSEDGDKSAKEAEKKAAEEVARLKELDLATASLEDATRLLSL